MSRIFDFVKYWVFGFKHGWINSILCYACKTIAGSNLGIFGLDKNNFINPVFLKQVPKVGNTK